MRRQVENNQYKWLKQVPEIKAFSGGWMSFSLNVWSDFIPSQTNDPLCSLVHWLAVALQVLGKGRPYRQILGIECATFCMQSLKLQPLPRLLVESPEHWFWATVPSNHAKQFVKRLAFTRHSLRSSSFLQKKQYFHAHTLSFKLRFPLCSTVFKKDNL